MDGPGIAAVGIGIIFLYGSIKGYSPIKAFDNVIHGENPNHGQSVNAPLVSQSASNGNTSVSGNINGPAKNGDTSAAAIASYKAFAQALVIQHGWSGQFADLDWVIMHESGYNPLATNPSSRAFGIAQALGHGTASTQGSISDEYGNFGTSDAICQAANNGNGYAQLIWMCNYIASRYGSPANTRAQYSNGY